MPELLFPIIVPRSYFSLGNWPGPHRPLRHPELAVTWVELPDSKTMNYVTFDRQLEIEASGIPIHDQAMENLRHASVQLITHSKNVDGQLIFGAMMHEDALGTSRLLLLKEISSQFPDGALLGIPERSCGIVAPLGISADQRREVEEMVASCYKDGTSPMLDGLHEAQVFELADA